MTFPSTVRTLGLALLLLIPAAAAAGWVIVDEAGHRTALSRGRLKIAPPDARGVSMVLDIGRARMWVADAERRLFWEGTVEEYCQGMRGAMAGAMADMDKQMADAMKDLPPAQREQMQQMLRNLGGGRGEAGPAAPAPRVTIEKTGETDRIAGLPVRKYRVLSDGRLYEDVWLTTDPALLRELELGRAPDTFGRMSGCMASLAGGGPRPEASEEFRTLYAEGWPLKVVYYGAGAGPGGAETTIAKVERQDIPEREFSTPAGYRAAPLSEVLGSRQPR
jgi:hypothetical protein